jgi:ubiquinol-cytochrome c reductase iron-sulfur subunit
MSTPRESVRRSETTTAALLFAAALAAAGFVVAYLLEAPTQVLGVTSGGALMLLAVAAILAGKRVVRQEEVVGERPAFGDSDQEAATAAALEAGADGISRRRLLAGGAAVAGTALGAALIVPAASLGPSPGAVIGASPWRRGRRVVGEDGAQLRPDDIELGSFVTGFPEGGDRRTIGAAVVIVRLPPDDLHLPADRSDWAPQGILAFSKICTHAGCSINLYRYPLYAPTSPRPALVCPCHYSTFDPSRGGERIFGPAGRALPQLPLAIDDDGGLVTAGGFSGPVGPAWSGVRSRDS